MFKTKAKFTFTLLLLSCVTVSLSALDWSNIDANEYGLKVTNDTEKLYFQFDEDPSKGENVQLYIDSDNNKQTGYTNDSLENQGSDFVIIGNTLYKSSENGSAWAFKKVEDSQNGITYQKNGTKTELSIEKTVLTNLTKDIKIGILHCIQSSKVIPYTQLTSQPQIPTGSLSEFIALNYKFDACTLNGATSNNGKLNRGAQFNGVNNFINVGSLEKDFSQGFSFSGWINFAQNAGGKEWESIFTTDTQPTTDSNPNSHSNGIWLIRYKNENKLYFTFRNDGKHCADVYTKRDVLTPGIFQHITATIDANNFPHIYINGIEVALEKHVVSEGGQCSIPNIKRDLTYIARPNDRFSNNNYFEGTLDEIKIFNKTLSQNDITTIYENESNGKDFNGTQRASVVCTQIPTPDTTLPVITLVGDSIITLTQGETYNELGVTATDNIDGILTNATVSGTVNPNVIGTYVLTYSVKDSSNNISTITRTVHVVKKVTPQIPTGPLKQHININQTFDSCVLNGATNSGGKINSGAQFNGNGNYIQVSSLQKDLSHGFTISSWARFDSTNGSRSWDRIIDLSHGSVGTDAINFARRSNSNKLQIQIHNKECSNKSSKLITNEDVIDGALHHYAGVVDANGNAKIYVDGIEKASGRLNCMPKSTQKDIVYIGKSSWSSRDYFKGLLDEVKVFDAPATANDILTIYQNESSGKNYDGTPRENIECTNTTTTIPPVSTQTPQPSVENVNINIDGRINDWETIPSLVVDNGTLKAHMDDEYLYLLLNTTKETGTTLFYLDVDNNDATGRSIWKKGKGIDYKLANSRLYKYVNRKFVRVRNTRGSIKYRKKGSVLELKIKKSLLSNIGDTVELGAVRYNRRTWKKSISFPSNGLVIIDR